MDVLKNIKAIWEGELLLNQIRWNIRSDYEFKLPFKYESKIKENWHYHLKENPQDYNGKLLFLDNFHFENHSLLLDTSIIKFSTVIYMVKQKIFVEKGIGVLGTQYAVYSPCKKYLLIGERSLNQNYSPGAITRPGGILEINDLNKSPKEAFMRELYEEVSLPLNLEAFLKAILIGWNGVSVTFLISVLLNDSYDFNPKENIPGEKDEWENNLRWYSINMLKNLNPNQILDGLTYLRLKFII